MKAGITQVEQVLVQESSTPNQWLIDHDHELGGVELSHRVWLEMLKIEIKRRGLVVEKKIKLVKGEDIWKES